MKNFFKTALIVLLVGIVIASIAGNKPSSSGNNTLTSVINQFEEDIANGSVIKDGVINGATSVEGEVEVTSNALATIINRLGSLLITGIGKLLKLIAELITKFIG
ncbi:MAG: hypothetical protein J1F32_04750 [Erysipelotrichales bacterium]|nr:hypothetical protein [Erysipelotrichales bacterium]